MPRYEKEYKEQTVKKMMPPNAVSVAQLSRDTGVSEATLSAIRAGSIVKQVNFEL